MVDKNQMKTKLQLQIENVLLEFPEYWEEEELLRNRVIEDIRLYKEPIIRGLLSNDLITDTYSLSVGERTVFKVEEFVTMLRSKNYWENSYTKYTNDIGLASEEKYLKYSTDVVLDFPHKDGVLEGSMTKEEIGKTEVYYHNVIAKEEIDTLLASKVLTNMKKYDQYGEHNLVDFEDADNLILKGNNLIALHTLRERFSGKIKLIYIDPPFNTGGDSFKYNDRFNHSTWLTFMKNRLEAARDLLSDDGTIYIHLDFNEVHYCKVLMDEIFGRENFLNEVIWAYRERETSKKFFNRKHDTILFYAKNKKSNYVFNSDLIREEYSDVTISKFKFTDEEGRKYRLRTKDGKSDPAIENENTYRQYLDKDSGPLPRDWFVIPFLNQSSDERVGFHTQKPESVIAKFIKASTNKNDIVLDFFSGTATTLAVAHKLNRRYIGIEQMDYINEYSVPRLQRVIEGEQGGISKDIEWQGGGSFVYAELHSLNDIYIKDIQAASSEDTLDGVLTKMKDTAYLNFKVDISRVTSEDEGYKSLSLEEKKEVLIQTLDMNQLYLNYSEIEDTQHVISDEVKQFNHSFYQKEGEQGE